MNRKIVVIFLMAFAFFVLVEQSYAAFSWEDSLVAHYKMNDNADTDTVIDSRGYSNGTAQQNTSILHTTGKNGGALTFNGEGDYVSTNNTFNPIFRDDFSISLWAKPSGEWTSQNNSFVGTLDFTDHFSGITLMVPECSVEGGIYLEYNAGIGNQIAIASDLTSDGSPIFIKGQEDWRHLVAIIGKISETTTIAYIYVDGKLVNTTLEDMSMSGYESDVALGIGCLDKTVGQDFFTIGILDNVMIFNKALSDDEIVELYNLGDGTENKHEISGQVILYGGPADVTDVLLTLSGATSKTTNPDANGNYNFNCWELFDYTVTPTLNDYYFFPTNYSYASISNNQTEQDFTGLHRDYDGDDNGISDWREMRVNDDDDNDYRCFLTTLFASRMGNKDGILCEIRDFRDNYLLTNPLGEIIVNAYYGMSPTLVRFIKENSILENTAKGLLYPLVWISGKI